MDNKYEGSDPPPPYTYSVNRDLGFHNNYSERPDVEQQVQVVTGHPPTDYKTAAFIARVCFCPILGKKAMMLNDEALTAYRQGATDRAAMLSKSARDYTIASYVIGIVVTGICVALLVLIISQPDFIF